MGFFGLQASPFFLQTQRWSLLPNSSIFVSEAVASSLLSGLSGYVDIGLVFTVAIDTFAPVSSNIFTRSFAVVLGLICTFQPKYIHL
jgi:hypothetical protein